MYVLGLGDGAGGGEGGWRGAIEFIGATAWLVGYVMR